MFSEGVERWHTRDEQYLPRKCSCAACQGLKGLGGRSPNPETRESYPLHMGCPWTGQGGKRCRITHRGQSQTSTVVKMGKKKKKCEQKVSMGGKVSKVMEKYGMTGREKGWMRETVRRDRLNKRKKMKAQESQQIDEVMADDPSWADDHLQFEREYNQFVSRFSPFQRAVRWIRWTCSCIKCV